MSSFPRGRPRWTGLVAAILASLGAIACDTVDLPVCIAYEMCEICTSDPECSWCLETGQCLPSNGQCGGDWARTGDMCFEEKPVEDDTCEGHGQASQSVPSR